ncbi:MAG TPA: HAD family hydrolase [Bacillota bacterium]
MTYKVIFLDIDGTVLKPDDHTYCPSTKEAISQVQQQGIEVFFATGRPLHDNRKLMDEFQVDSYIGYNGSYAIYKNEPIWNEPFKEETVNRFLQLAKKNEHELAFYTHEKNYFTSPNSSVSKLFAQTFQLKQNVPFQEDIVSHILGTTIVDLKTNDPSMYEVDSDIHLSPVPVESEANCYDVIRRQVNKGKAIKHILKELGISPKEAIAFGDGLNDVEMFQTVGESFAMGNAHPNLVPHAKHRTTSVYESGIYNGLKRLGIVG